MSKPSRKSVCNLFYGYQVEEIMRVCVVSEGTAQHFKRGTRSPSKQAKKLWWLHIGGRILGSEWSRLKVRGDALLDAAGNRYSEGEILSLPWLHQLIAELRRQVDRQRLDDEVSRLDCDDLEESLRRLLQNGTKLLESVAKIPKRRLSSDAKKRARMGALAVRMKRE